MSLYEIDEYGRAVIDSDGLFELWFKNSSIDLNDVVVKYDDAIKDYNEECERRGKQDFLISEDNALPIPHSTRNKEWLIPELYQKMDIEKLCLDRAGSEVEKNRVITEMKMFDERELIPLLQCLVYLVDCFRENNVLWGVGRGSSVSSYVLFLIGIHRINPLRYNLDISEFLR